MEARWGAVIFLEISNKLKLRETTSGKMWNSLEQNNLTTYLAVIIVSQWVKMKFETYLNLFWTLSLNPTGKYSVIFRIFLYGGGFIRVERVLFFQPTSKGGCIRGGGGGRVLLEGGAITENTAHCTSCFLFLSCFLILIRIIFFCLDSTLFPEPDQDSPDWTSRMCVSSDMTSVDKNMWLKIDFL